MQYGQLMGSSATLQPAAQSQLCYQYDASAPPALATSPVQSDPLMAAQSSQIIGSQLVQQRSVTRTRGHLSRTTQVSRYQKGKTSLDFTEARHSEWQWHQLGHMQVCTLLQTDNHTSTPPLYFLQARCPSCRPTNSVKALKAEVS